MKRLYSLAILMLTMAGSIFGADVKVEMNSTTTTMTLNKKGTGESVDIGSPNGKIYTFAADPGDYILTGFEKDGSTQNGAQIAGILNAIQPTNSSLSQPMLPTRDGLWIRTTPSM